MVNSQNQCICEAPNSVANPQFTRRFSLNLITNLVSIGLSTIIGLFLIPYFINTLGEIAYSLVPLATSITSYVTLLTNALNTSVSRYLMMDLRSGKINIANQIYSTAFISIICAVIILLPIALFVAQLSPNIFNIGNIVVSEVQLLFTLIFISSLVTIISSNFTATLYAYNRFDLRNAVTITQTGLQVILIVILFTFIKPDLILIGVSYLTASLVALFLSIILSRKTCSELQIKKEYIKKESFIDLWSMTVWTVVKALGCLLRSNIGLIIANIICGAVIGAHYAIVVQWQMLLISLMASLSILFNPVIFSHCARKELPELNHFLSIALRTTTITVAIIIGLLATYAPEILTLWVGSEYATLSIFAIIIVIPVFMQAPSDILNNVMIANLKFKQVGLIYLLAGIFTLVCSAIGAYFFGMFGLIIAGGLVMILCEGGIIFLYAAHLLDRCVFSMLKYLIPGLVMLAVTINIGFIVKIVFDGTSIFSLIIGGAVIAVLSGLICSRLLLSKKDKTEIRACMPAWIEKRLPKCLF